MGTTYLAWDQAGITGSRQPQLLVLKEMNADMAKIAKAKNYLKERLTLSKRSIMQEFLSITTFVEAGKILSNGASQRSGFRKRILNTGPVTQLQAITWMIQTCDVLDYIHKQYPPLIHRDIKPANLIVRSLDNRIVVLDFGAVKEIGTAPGTRIGAEGYCAPEQERGQPLTQSDLYAIGPTLIFC
jgi:serine/threonine-protein kinase